MLSRSAARRIGKLSLYSHNKSSSSSIHHTKKNNKREASSLPIFSRDTLHIVLIMNSFSSFPSLFHVQLLSPPPPPPPWQVLTSSQWPDDNDLPSHQRCREGARQWARLNWNDYHHRLCCKRSEECARSLPPLPTTSTPIESWFNNEVHVAHSETR